MYVARPGKKMFPLRLLIRRALVRPEIQSGRKDAERRELGNQNVTLIQTLLVSGQVGLRFDKTNKTGLRAFTRTNHSNVWSHLVKE